MAHIILVTSSLNASEQRRINILHEVRKAFPIERSPLKARGGEGLRENPFWPAGREEVQIQ
jgi:hypothetical protein